MSDQKYIPMELLLNKLFFDSFQMNMISLIEFVELLNEMRFGDHTSVWDTIIAMSLTLS